MRPHHLLAAGLLVLLSSPTLSATERDFRALAKAIESRFGVRREQVPMMGLASFIARVSTANSVRGIEIEGQREGTGSARASAQRGVDDSRCRASSAKATT